MSRGPCISVTLNKYFFFPSRTAVLFIHASGQPFKHVCVHIKVCLKTTKHCKNVNLFPYLNSKGKTNLSFIYDTKHEIFIYLVILCVIIAALKRALALD